jgi:uncharacterized protein (TIGR03437 family)
MLPGIGTHFLQGSAWAVLLLAPFFAAGAESPRDREAAGPLAATSAPAIASVVNGASFLAGFTQGSWITIFGSNLSGTTRIWTSADFNGTGLPTSLDEVSVTVDGKSAYIYYISPTQIDALAPADTTVGPAAVQVTFAGVSSNSLSATEASFSPALFMFPADSAKYVAAVRSDGQYIGPTTLYSGVTEPAKSGDILLLFGTGFGPTNPTTDFSQTVGTAAPTANTVTATIGGVAATVEYAGLVAAGEYQFNIVAPSVPDGDNLVVLTVNGVTSQSGAYLYVSGSSSATSTSVALTASSTSLAYGSKVTFTATVSPSAATGTVTFYDGTTSLGSSTLSSGSASLSTSSLAVGTHSITASYGGASGYAGSTSSAVTATVTASTTATTIALTASSTSTTVGSSVTLTANVSPPAATGTVTFYEGSTSLGTGTLSSGTATLTMSFDTAGTYSLTAVYGGDSTHAGNTSSAVTETVTSSSTPPTTIALSASPRTIAYGSGTALTAIVTPVGSTGTVTFTDTSTSSTLGTAALSAQSVATLTVTSLAAGSHTVTAAYSSTASGSVAITVAAAAAGSFTANASCGYTRDSATANYVLTSGTLATSGTAYDLESGTDENVICIEGASAYLTLIDPTIVSKAGELSSLDGDVSWYGLNAAVLDYNGGAITIDGGSVATSGAGGNMVYSYGTGTVTISNATITSTSSNNGHGIYAAGGGTIVANNVTATSSGGASSIVATDSGGGAVTINGGSYEATGGKSAGIYSTGQVYGYNAVFTSTEAEAAVIEGDNSINLTNVTLNSASSGTHRGIFLYQSMSGDANNTGSTCESIATGDCFVMTNGAINYTDTTSGDTDPANNCTAFEVYNQTSLVILTDVTINNSCGTLLLSGYNDQWSNSNAYGYATFKAYGTALSGNIIVGDTCLSSACSSRDTTSTAGIYLYEDSAGVGSKLTGAINTADTGKTVALTLDSASKWVVTGTSYLTSLTDADATYSNIACQTSGCKVYVNGSEISIN